MCQIMSLASQFYNLKKGIKITTQKKFRHAFQNILDAERNFFWEVILIPLEYTIETKRKRLYKIEDRLFLFYNALFADDFKKNVTKYLDISLFGRDKERI